MADEEGLDLPAPPRPRWVPCAAFALAVPVMFSMFGCGLVAELGAKAGLASEVPRIALVSMSLGTMLLLTVLFVVFAIAMEKRWRGARLTREGIAFGLGHPGLSRVRWQEVEGFACASGRVRLVLRGQRTGLFAPVIWCEGEVMSRVVERLEAEGIRRVDG
jgi:hypothetical protein